MDSARKLCATTDNPDFTFVTYDQTPYPHHLTRAIHTSDFVYRGPALDISPQAQARSEVHLFNLAAGRGIAGTFSPVFLNASGTTTEPNEDDVLGDAVHRDRTYTSPPTKRVNQVQLQDWVNRNLGGGQLDIAFWVPLAKLLDHVRAHWMGNGVDERRCYELTVRSVKFHAPEGPDIRCPLWHTEWWYPGLQQPDSPSAADDYCHESGSSGHAISMSPTERPNIFNTVDLSNPLFQHLPGTSSPTSPPYPDSSWDADAPADRGSPEGLSPVASPPPSYRRSNLHIDVFRANSLILSPHFSATSTSSAPAGQLRFSIGDGPLNMPLQHDPTLTDGSRSERFASRQRRTTQQSRNHTKCQLPSIFAPVASPTSLSSSPNRAVHVYDQISASPSSSMQVEPSVNEAGAQGASPIRIIAPLAGPGTLFINEPSAVAVLVRGSEDGTEHAVRAPKQGELAVWRAGCGEKGYGPVYAAPSVTMFEPTKGQLVGRDRVFVSLVVGTEEQVRMLGSRS